MAINFLRRPDKYVGRIAQLGVVTFLVSIALAYVDTVWAVYLNTFLHNNAMVGALSAFFTIISLIAFLFIPRILRKHSEVKVYSYSLAIMILGYMLYAFTSQFELFLLVAMALVVFASFRAAAFGIITRNESKPAELGRNEGIIFVFMNLGWLIGPLVAGLVFQEYGIAQVFMLASIFLLFGLLGFKLLKSKEVRHTRKGHPSVWLNMKHFFSNIELIKSYVMKGGISLWWGIIYIYVPLYILENGLDVIWIGVFLFAVCVPLVLLEYSVGVRADKRGFKWFLIRGYFMLSLGAMAAFFVGDVSLMLLVLVLASFGAALIEPTAEAYFFKLIPVTHEEALYGPFRTSGDVGSITGKLAAAGVLLFLPFNWVFLVLALEMALVGVVALKLKEQKLVLAACP